MSSEYEKVLEETNEKLHQEIEILRKLLFDLAPRIDSALKSYEKEVANINNGYYERGQGCTVLLKKIKKDREAFTKDLEKL